MITTVKRGSDPNRRSYTTEWELDLHSFLRKLTQAGVCVVTQVYREGKQSKIFIEKPPSAEWDMVEPVILQALRECT